MSLIDVVEFPDSLSESEYISSKIYLFKDGNSSLNDSIIATDSKVIKNTLINLNDLFQSDDFSYEKFLIMQLCKFLFNLNYDYENRELIAIYNVNEDLKGILNEEIIKHDDLFLTWNYHKIFTEKLIEKTNEISKKKFNQYLNKISCYIGKINKNKHDEMFNESKDGAIFNERKENVNKKYSHLSSHEKREKYIEILNAAMNNLDIQKMNSIINISQIDDFQAKNLYIAGLSECSFLLDELKKNYENIYISTNKSININMKHNMQIIKSINANDSHVAEENIATEEQLTKCQKTCIVSEFQKMHNISESCEEKEISNKLQFKFEDLELRLNASKRFSDFNLSKFEEDIMTFYVKSILNLKFVNYDIYEYVPFHIRIILMRYMVNFNENVIDEYLSESKFFSIDNLKIKLKSNNLIKQIKSMMKNQIISKKHTNICIDIYLSVNNIMQIRANYDFFIILTNKTGILFKFIFASFNAKDIKLYRNLQINILLLSAFKILSKYNLSDMKICFIDSNNVFEIMLSEIDYDEIYINTEKKVNIAINKKHCFGFDKLSKNYKLNQLMKYYDKQSHDKQSGIL
ncbi:hypothetical protein FZC35_01865 [Candidatus Cytomitobacter indipagum]|uniref:Uncharacterized protein n=1 Tax=Candidatus Cytomitobacter indipagum TaxID=2601575 RepID=A0A5C0UEP7_9PROT|nr:hypothetical protein [Candidatus Cytomitobacter indipagum]QEK38113.1 hypothetical protein FZC35_01865 [Candidatus Cytomitobacter indipagum]